MGALFISKIFSKVKCAFVYLFILYIGTLFVLGFNQGLLSFNFYFFQLQFPFSITLCWFQVGKWELFVKMSY